ncbi:endonuclease/exonuclease/phosphatase family protein [Pseudahrensia aquimaris]|uniref:Endonuclease/exonuclease/phosphatase family protein n=1 Tax=Pseudahrensia aquimaris TaxID=744461 RepID=A0ABW3FE45_9HYPH
MTFLRLLLGFTLVSLAGPIIAGMLGAVHPMLDAFAHFRVHLVVLLLACVVVTVLLEMKWLSRFGIGVVALSLAATLPYLPGLDRLTSAQAEGDELTLVQFNMYFLNSQTDAVEKALKQFSSDFIVLQEVTETTEPALVRLRSSHPFQLSCRFGAIGSVAIASRHPFVETTMKKCIRAYGLASARFSVAGREVTVGSYHSYWPWPISQHKQIDTLEENLRQMRAPILLAGDFNAAPWSHAVKRIEALTGTKAAAGLLSTWSPSLGNWRWPDFMGLTIDNALHSDDFSLQERFTGMWAGSDHLPVISRFRWVKPAQSLSANASSSVDLRIFPVDDAGSASATTMRLGRL